MHDRKIPLYSKMLHAARLPSNKLELGAKHTPYVVCTSTGTGIYVQSARQFNTILLGTLVLLMNKQLTS